MIEPGELHRYFIVRDMANDREVWILGGDVRYELTGDGLGHYRPAPDGDYFLARSAVETHPWGRPMRLQEVEPLPDGRGVYHPDHADLRSLQMSMTYEGSWRQYAREIGTHYHRLTDGVPGHWTAPPCTCNDPCQPVRPGTVVMCPKCKRQAFGWPLERGDRCSPRDWVNCIRQPEAILAAV